MNYLLDTSSIFELLLKNDLKFLKNIIRNSYTLDLTIYEIGNVIWKRYSLIKDISSREVEKIIKIIQFLLSKMNMLQLTKNLTYMSDIIELAKKENISFYDASYLFFATKYNLILITEDQKLKEIAKKYVNVYSISGIKI